MGAANDFDLVPSKIIRTKIAIQEWIRTLEK